MSPLLVLMVIGGPMWGALIEADQTKPEEEKKEKEKEQ